MNSLSLAGRVAIVTGGGSGIGRAIAMRMAVSGAAVALWDRDPGAMGTTAREVGGATRVHAVEVDVSDHPGVVRAAATISQRLGYRRAA